MEETACVGTSNTMRIFIPLSVYLSEESSKIFYMQVNKSGHWDAFPSVPTGTNPHESPVTQQIKVLSPRHSQDSGGCFSQGIWLSPPTKSVSPNICLSICPVGWQDSLRQNQRLSYFLPFSCKGPHYQLVSAASDLWRILCQVLCADIFWHSSRL